jgi:exopolysaccharide biosynthesis WecB/TagA/CpsF family protein
MLQAQEMTGRSLEIIGRIDFVASKKDNDALFDRLANKLERPIIVSWLNAHVLTLARKDGELTDALLRSSVLLRDGIGISLMLHLCGKDAGLNMNGTDLIPEIVRRYSGRNIALMGTREPYLSKAAEAVAKHGCKVVLRVDGFQEAETYVRELTTHDADLVVLGMGVPKQEKVALLLAERASHPILILNGGAILDFMAGRFLRAPMIWRKLHLEWLFRMLQEPRRLWRRYILGGIFFVFFTVQVVLAARLGYSKKV